MDALGRLVAAKRRLEVGRRSTYVGGSYPDEKVVGQAGLAVGVGDAQQRHQEAVGEWVCPTKSAEEGELAGL